jgi:RNA polymerase sigma-70 factor (ECF subfamily)
VGQFRGWLCRLAQNEIADAWRRLRRLRRDPGRDAVPEPPPVRWEDGAWEEAFGAYIHRLALDRVRARVGKRTWILFKLTWFVGCPPERVARRFGLPVGRVFEAKCRVLARFRQEVRALAEEAAALVPVEPKGACGGISRR